MDHTSIEKIVTALIVSGVVIIAIIRVGAGTAAVAGLGHVPMSMIPTRLRRFLFGERNDSAHKPNN
jgi:hypothetical protein